MPSRSWFWPAAFWPAAVVLAGVVAGPAAAQPPSPLELVRGVREAGMPDLALEYLRDIEKDAEGKFKGRLTAGDKAAIPLERARCLLDAAADEPDEGTRTSLIGEAKEGFSNFLALHGGHPRASEASLALAKLTALEAKAQLNRARRMDIPDTVEPGHEEALDRQRKEAERARPLFLTASKRFADAAKQMRARLADKSLDARTREAIAREVFDADLAAAVNQYNLAETYLSANAARAEERDKLLEGARARFAALAGGPAARGIWTAREWLAEAFQAPGKAHDAAPAGPTAWIAKAWMAEVLGDQNRVPEMQKEFDEILKSPAPEAAEGKRTVKFFQARREYLAAIQEQPRVQSKLQAAERVLRDWLRQYGNTARPTPEVLAARYYLAFDLQLQAVASIGTGTTVGPTARSKLGEAERLYRGLSQSDNDYTARATRYRMLVVRKMLGEADHPAASYATFEEAQMASLIQMSKLNDAEKFLAEARAGGDEAFWAAAAHRVGKAKYEAEAKDRKQRVVALLERARELATDKDTPGDVTDNLLRLIYFYQDTGQPYQAAVLGEHVARTVRATGGKASIAGVMALNGYTAAAARIPSESADPAAAEKVAAAAAAARKADRERAVRVARFLDKQFPNDTATDVARHRLAGLLYEDGRTAEAFEAVTKVRPGYAQIAAARQLEGFLAALLVNAPPDAPLPAGGKAAVFQRATADIGRVVRPGPGATEEDVRGYLGCRLRLAGLYLAQGRVGDPALAALAGYEKALGVADEAIAMIPSFDALAEGTGADKKPNLDGQELNLQAYDLRTRALYLKGKALVDAHELDKAAAAIDPALADVTKAGALFNGQMRQWNGGDGDRKSVDDPADPDAAQKKKIAALAAGIDENRRNVIMVGFKLRAVQGKKDDAVAVLNLLEKAGGSFEASQSSLELMGREMAAQIAAFKRENKAAEAKALGDGLAELLKRLAAIPNRPPSSTLFIGQTLLTVGQFDDALKEFAKIPAPALPPGTPPTTSWWKVDPSKLANGQDRRKFQDEVRDYRFAQLGTAKAHHGAGRNDEAEKMLTGIIGTGENQGWGYGSLDARKELAEVYESKGAALGTNVKAANVEWGKALKEWTILFSVAKRALENAPKDANPDPKREPTEQEKKLRSNFFDAYYEIQRVMVAANTQLLAGNPKLAATFADVGKKIADMEKQDRFAAVISPEVATRYRDLLDKYPELKKGYKAAGGDYFTRTKKD